MNTQMMSQELVATVQRERMVMSASRSQEYGIAQAGRTMSLMAGARRWFTGLRPRLGRPRNGGAPVASDDGTRRVRNLDGVRPSLPTISIAR